LARERVPNRAGNLTAKQRRREYKEDDARWDALLATEESQRLLEELADEALWEIEAGQAKPMVFPEDGEIVPG
jgi:hypothetical protein